MGLDMYAYAVEQKDAVNSLEIAKDCEMDRFFYWRKHHDLHGWMQQLFEHKGGSGEFNCQVVELTDEDLDLLTEAVMHSDMPHTTGFFFGNNPPDEDSKANDLDFISQARQKIKEGKVVYYDSWW